MNTPRTIELDLAALQALVPPGWTLHLHFWRYEQEQMADLVIRRGPKAHMMHLGMNRLFSAPRSQEVAERTLRYLLREVFP